MDNSTWDIFILKILFIWNLNLTGSPVFLFAKSDNPTTQGHMVIKGWSQDLNPGSVIIKNGA